ncbi:hypothetical protein [uncultured Pseudoxanthomonas sp.]|nr:hypothetical protein [uncultured Pseudoxanthomonas sp.]
MQTDYSRFPLWKLMRARKRARRLGKIQLAVLLDRSISSRITQMGWSL